MCWYSASERLTQDRRYYLHTTCADTSLSHGGTRVLDGLTTASPLRERRRDQPYLTDNDGDVAEECDMTDDVDDVVAHPTG